MAHTVGDLMTESVVTVHEDSTFREMVQLMHERRVSALPVVDLDGVIVGVVSEADLLVKEDPDVMVPRFFDRRVRRIERGKAVAVIARDLMTAPAVTVPANTEVPDAAHLMRERGVKRLFVTDTAGKVLGVVSRADLLVAFLRSDADVAEDVEELLRHAGYVIPGTFKVRVEDGIVHAEGRVEQRTAEPELLGQIRAIEGVVGVDANVTWEYDDAVGAGFGPGWMGV
jgi:CBS domain-containing protein